MRYNKPAICWIFNASYDDIGGAGSRFRTEVSHFLRLNVPSIIICRNYPRGLPGRCSDLIVPTRFLPFYFLEVFLRATGAILQHRRTTFVVHDPITSVPASLACRLFGRRARAVLVVHGPMHLEQKWLAGRDRKKMALLPAISVVERLAYRLAHKLLPVSEYEANYLSGKFGLGRKSRMIRNGISVGTFASGDPSSFRKELGIDSNELLILNVGHLYPYRGLSELLEALSLVKTRGITTPKLAVVGKGSDENLSRFQREAAHLGISESVVFVGDRTDIPNVLRSGDVYAERFSKEVNGIGISIMEAMAAGVPVVTGSDWITRNLLRHKEDCLLVNKEDSIALAEGIISLIHDPALRAKLGNNAQGTAKMLFSSEAMLKACQREYLDSPFDQ